MPGLILLKKNKFVFRKDSVERIAYRNTVISKGLIHQARKTWDG